MHREQADEAGIDMHTGQVLLNADGTPLVPQRLSDEEARKRQQEQWERDATACRRLCAQALNGLEPIAAKQQTCAIQCGGAYESHFIGPETHARDCPLMAAIAALRLAERLFGDGAA